MFRIGWYTHGVDVGQLAADDMVKGGKKGERSSGNIELKEGREELSGSKNIKKNEKRKMIMKGK
jgi:hypothetical protein